MAQNWLEMLKYLGWSKAELARRLGLHPNTISHWGDEAPGYALAYLRLAVRVREVAKELEP